MINIIFIYQIKIYTHHRFEKKKTNHTSDSDFYCEMYRSVLLNHNKNIDANV